MICNPLGIYPVVLVLVVDVVVEAVDKQEMAVKVNNICIITVDLIL